MRKPVIAAILVLSLSSAVLAQNVIYVDCDATSGANDGESWTDAHTDLQNALAAAGSGDEIWVAGGTYKPTTGSDRFVSFDLMAGVAFYGGFAGTESARDERDWTAHETILSGDLNGDDDPSYALDDPRRMNGENSWHVVVGASDATLDGFTVTAGNADESAVYDHNRGGGIFHSGTGLEVAHCELSGNKAAYGGAMYSSPYASSVLSTCTVSANAADSSGGGICGSNGSSYAVTDCTFSGNEAALGGGAMANSVDSSSVLSGCVFSANSADDGGGIYNGHVSSHTITNCSFSGNMATRGGGIRNTQSSAEVVDCTFSDNIANSGAGIHNTASSHMIATGCSFLRNSGGGISNSESSPTVTGCVFSGNVGRGGGITNWRSSPVVTSCLFSGNSGDWGGAIHNYTECSLTVTNCIFWGNRASASGGAIHNSSGSTTALVNSILRANFSPWGIDIRNDNASASFTISHTSIVQTGGYADVGGNIDLDPEFVAPGHWDDNGTPGDESDDVWMDGDYHLQPGSPCIDSADGDAAPQFDIEGNPRHDDIGMPNIGTGAATYADMGAYEFQGTTPAVTPFAGGCVSGSGSPVPLAFLALAAGLACLRAATHRRALARRRRRFC